MHAVAGKADVQSTLSLASTGKLEQSPTVALLSMKIIPFLFRGFRWFHHAYRQILPSVRISARISSVVIASSAVVPDVQSLVF
jgi:hypothetical protein